MNSYVGGVISFVLDRAAGASTSNCIHVDFGCLMNSHCNEDSRTNPLIKHSTLSTAAIYHFDCQRHGFSTQTSQSFTAHAIVRHMASLCGVKS